MFSSIVIILSVMDLDYLKSMRGYQRAQVTRKFDHIQRNIDTLSGKEKSELLVKLRNIQQKVEDYDRKISAIIWESKDQESFNKELDLCNEYEEKLVQSIALLERSGTDNKEIVSNKLRLPDLPLPEYSHSKGESIEKFFQDFEDVTSRANLNSYSKLLYLQRQTRGEPLTLIRSLNAGSRTYEDAKDLLMKAFGCELNQKFEIIKLMTELKLSYSTDPYEVIGEMRMIKDSFKRLKISADDVLQYFYWNGLNEGFKSKLTEITGKSKPSLKEMEENMFEATNRYLESQKKFKPRKLMVDNPTSTLAANVKSMTGRKDDRPFRFYPCILCAKHKNSDKSPHAIYACPNYPDASSKLKRLETIKACKKCTRSHDSDKCTFKFKRSCEHCGDLHFPYLCMKIKGENKKEKKRTVDSEVSNNAACIDCDVLLMDNLQGSILPTFTVDLAGNRVRGLKDSGSQMTFIETGLSDRLGLRVLKSKFSILVNGINDSKKFETKVVELCLSVGLVSHVIRAVCIPVIKTQLKIPNLGRIVEGFKNKGYSLADQCLVNHLDEISDIKLLLGSDNDYVLPTSTVVFGPSTPSTFLDSPLGVLLNGDSRILLGNLDHLPDLNEVYYDFHISSMEQPAHTDRVVESELILSDETMNHVVLNESEFFHFF